LIASPRGSPPAATSAEYSPRLCPANSAGGRGKRFSTTRQIATDAARIAGWVISVRASSLSGPFSRRSSSPPPNAASASSSAARASPKARAKSRAMPTL
jgi:hypothetical protein